MIGWEDVYKVVSAMMPLYFALILGYGSVKWWRILSPEQCDAVNRLVCYFTLPLFNFEFTYQIDPYNLNYKFIGADAISKLIVVVVLALWANFSTNGSFSWSITSFSMATLTNSLVVGVPLLKAMYGQEGVDLVVQSSVLQGLVWLTLLLFVLEFRRTGGNEIADSSAIEMDLEENNGDVVSTSRPPFWRMMRAVWIKLAKNPNIYSSVLGLAWAFIANRWHIEMPSIVEGSISIMSKAGTGTAMFSMGLFMAVQKKLIACGTKLTLYGMFLRFVAGPAAMAIGAIAVGLRGQILSIVIIQSVLPQAIISFVFAKEYGLHANVISTAVIFGTIVSLPVLIGYYAVLELIN